MSERGRAEDYNAEGEKRQGPNLVLVYSLMAVALLVAMAVAALIVWPFYRR